MKITLFFNHKLPFHQAAIEGQILRMKLHLLPGSSTPWSSAGFGSVIHCTPEPGKNLGKCIREARGCGDVGLRLRCLVLFRPENIRIQDSSIKP